MFIIIVDTVYDFVFISLSIVLRYFPYFFFHLLVPIHYLSVPIHLLVDFVCNLLSKYPIRNSRDALTVLRGFLVGVKK